MAARQRAMCSGGAGRSVSRKEWATQSRLFFIIKKIINYPKEMTQEAIN